MKNKLIIVPIFLLGLVACSANNTNAQKNNVLEEDYFLQPTALPTEEVRHLDLQSENELIHIVGSAPGTSNSFTIGQVETINIHWIHQSADRFNLVLIRVDEVPEGEATEYTIANTVASGEGVKGFIVPAGEYIVQILHAGADWEIWVEVVTTEVENITSEGELIHIKGSGPGQSEVFIVEESVNFDVYWEHQSTDSIEVIYELNTGSGTLPIPMSAIEFSNSGTYKYGLSPGEYRINILTAIGEWEIWIIPFGD